MGQTDLKTTGGVNGGSGLKVQRMVQRVQVQVSSPIPFKTRVRQDLCHYICYSDMTVIIDMFKITQSVWMV